ncbi:MAG TPA: VTT domain-containing protein, partial [Chloroflexota bacterium]
MSTPTLARDGEGSSERSLSRYLKIGAVALGLIIAIWLLQRGSVDLDVIAVRGWLIDLGPIAPLAYIVVYALQVIVAPIPGLPIGAAAGFVFGLVPATIYGSIGLGLGVLVALLAGRLWGLRLLGRVAGPDAIAQWEQLRLVDSPATWLVIFLGPSPDLILFVAGMSRIPMARLVPIALIGRAPAMIAATLLGA